MPIYEYECPRCGCFEHSQSMHDRPLERCPKCRRKVQRLISATSFQLKGGGWYSDGYHKSGGAPKDAGNEAKDTGGTKAASESKTTGEEKKSDSSSGTSGSTTTESKPSKPKKGKAKSASATPD